MIEGVTSVSLPLFLDEQDKAVHEDVLARIEEASRRAREANQMVDEVLKEQKAVFWAHLREKYGLEGNEFAVIAVTDGMVLYREAKRPANNPLPGLVLPMMGGNL